MIDQLKIGDKIYYKSYNINDVGLDNLNEEIIRPKLSKEKIIFKVEHLSRFIIRSNNMKGICLGCSICNSKSIEIELKKYLNLLCMCKENKKSPWSNLYHIRLTEKTINLINLLSN